MTKRSRPAQSGFTLIELLIAMTILAIISLGVYDITNSTFSRRESIEQEGDFYNSLRVGLDVLGRDIGQLYTPQAGALPGTIGQAPQTTPGQPAQGQQAGGNPANVYGTASVPLGTATDYWGEPINESGVRPSRLQGEEGKLSFISNSHMRIYRDASESEFEKVSYSLEDPKTPDPLVKGKLLVKHEDPNAFIDEERGSETDVRYVLVDGVKSLSFEFLDSEKDTWSKRWDTSGIDHKGVYPAVIKITLEVYFPRSDHTFTVVQQYRPELSL
ncbi:MAG: prepilin-type N-terminal cleavage/methylation domain-containing protein [Deltaproteobacteria bacterium]|nr:prepilin-type N-terminal cleavage/methylation domain-containing protein [Deltaproteobacteria bacterium]